MKIYQCFRDENYLECQFIAKDRDEAIEILDNEYEIDIEECNSWGDEIYLLDELCIIGRNIILEKTKEDLK